MALRSWGDGPYGFSFELKRTLLVSSAVGGWVTGLVLASDSAGLTRAPAAPALNNCANLRREIVMLFIGILRPEFIVRSAPNCEIENVKFERLLRCKEFPMQKSPSFVRCRESLGRS